MRVAFLHDVSFKINQKRLHNTFGSDHFSTKFGSAGLNGLGNLSGVFLSGEFTFFVERGWVGWLVNILVQDVFTGEAFKE